MTEIINSNVGTSDVDTKMTMKERLDDAGSRLGIVGELLGFLWARKLWWLIPMIIALLVFGLFAAFAASSGVLSPFIYTLF